MVKHLSDYNSDHTTTDEECGQYVYEFVLIP